MYITKPKIHQPAIPHITFCLADNQDYPQMFLPSQNIQTENAKNIQKIHKTVSAIGEDSVTYKIVPENAMKSKDWIVHRKTLLNCADILNDFSQNLGETKAINKTKSTNDKVGNSHDKTNNKKPTAQSSKTKKAKEVPAETSEDTDSEN